MRLSHKKNNIIRHICRHEASQSPCTYKLGSVITKGRNKIMCSGFNDNMRTRYLHKTTCCQHAEMAVATQFINRYVRRNQIKVSCQKA